MKPLTIVAIVGTVLATSAGVAHAKDGRHGDRREAWREIHRDRSEIRQDIREIHQDRRAMREAARSRDRAAFLDARRELVRDRQELRRDVGELRRDERRFGFDRDDARGERRHGPPSWAPAWGWRAKHDAPDADRARLRDDDRWWWQRGWRDDDPQPSSWRDRFSFWRGWR